MKVFRRFVDVFVAIAIVAGVDAALFHFDVYNPWLEPDSYSGLVEQTSRRFRLTQRLVSDEKIVLLGNSSAGAGMLEEEIENGLVELNHQVSVINMAQGGSTPRAWFYLLKHEPFTGDECPVVVLGLFLPSLAKDADEGPDLSIVKSRIGVTDVPSLPSMFEATEDKLRMGFLGILKTPLFRDDIVDFIARPSDRIRAVKENQAWEKGFETGWRRTNQSGRDLTSAHLNGEGKLVEADLAGYLKKDPKIQEQLTRALKRQQRTAQVKELHFNPIRMEYLRRVVELANRRGSAVILAVMPATPFPNPGRYESMQRELRDEFVSLRASGADIELFEDGDLLNTLERPEFFSDMLHLNRKGAERYSAELKDAIDSAIGDE